MPNIAIKIILNKLSWIDLKWLIKVGEPSSKYYNGTDYAYRIFWDRDHLHYGLWDKETTEFKQALINTVRRVVSELELEQGDVVLDVGCGYGGASRYMAENFDISVTGITLSTAHLKYAKIPIYNKNYKDRVKFLRRDFTNTKFTDRSFTKVFGIESVCYSKDKADFINEAYRLLKKSGKLVVIDGFFRKTDLKQPERQLYNEFLRGWFLPNLATSSEFREKLLRGGFKNITYEILTEKIIPSSHRMYKITKLTQFFPYISVKLKLKPPWRYWHAIANIRQMETLQKRIWEYGIFAAEKL